MKKLLIEEMRRAIELMEADPALYKLMYDKGWLKSNPTVTELRQLLQLIRKHSIAVMKNLEDKPETPQGKIPATPKHGQLAVPGRSDGAYYLRGAAPEATYED